MREAPQLTGQIRLELEGGVGDRLGPCICLHHPARQPNPPADSASSSTLAHLLHIACSPAPAPGGVTNTPVFRQIAGDRVSGSDLDNYSPRQLRDLPLRQCLNAQVECVSMQE